MTLTKLPDPGLLRLIALLSLTLPHAVHAADSDWPVPRGDAQSTGRSSQTLPENLEVLWESSKTEGAFEVTPVISDGRLFVADDIGNIYALNATDGTELWRQTYDDMFFLASAAVKGDLVVLGDLDGNVYALETATGKERWKQTTGAEVSPASFHQDNVLVASQDGVLYCFSAKDGSTVWTYQADDQIRCSPTIAGDTTFLGGCDGQLHIVDLKSGKALGPTLPLDGPTGSTPAVADTKAFLPIMDGLVYAFDLEKKTELWRYVDEDRLQEYRSSAAISDGLVIVNSVYRQVDAIDIETGKRRWRHTLRRRADASPVIAGDDVWIAATDGRLVRLSLDDGTDEKWSYEIRGAFLAAPAIADNRLFIADDEGVVRCFGVKSK